MLQYMARRLAFRLTPHLDTEDLIHAGVIGLMDAFEKFDPIHNAQFKTYAEFRVRGAMLDEIREADWVPRSVRDKAALLYRTIDALTKNLCRSPSDEEAAAALGISSGAYATLLAQTNAVTLLSLDDVHIQQDDEVSLMDSLADSSAENPLLSLLSQDVRNGLLQAIQSLGQKEQMVVALYYNDELTMKEIGQVLDITESRVCQIHAIAISKLKNALGGVKNGEWESKKNKKSCIVSGDV